MDDEAELRAKMKDMVRTGKLVIEVATGLDRSTALAEMQAVANKMKEERLAECEQQLNGPLKKFTIMPKLFQEVCPDAEMDQVRGRSVVGRRSSRWKWIVPECMNVEIGH